MSRRKPVRKTTVYLPDELKVKIEETAVREGRSEADVIRDALEQSVARRRAPEPRVPLPNLALGDPTVAERAGDLLEGFGE